MAGTKGVAAMGMIVLIVASSRAQVSSPSPRAIPTPFGTPDANGHVNVNLPLTPPKGSPYERNPIFYARERAMCQMIADRMYAHQFVDWDEVKECGQLRYEIWVYSNLRPSPAETGPKITYGPSPTPVPTPLQEPPE